MILIKDFEPRLIFAKIELIPVDTKEGCHYINATTGNPDLFNSKYTVFTIRKEQKDYTMIYDKQTNEQILFRNQGSGLWEAPLYMGIQNNALISVIQAVELVKYVDYELLDSKSRTMFKTITEDGNPVLVKFFLKK